MGNRNGISLTGAFVVIGVVVFLFMILIPAGCVIKQPLHPRLVCGTNLKGMANALNVYAFDYRDEYPVQGAGTHKWGTTTTGWDDPEKDWKNSTGTLTVASSLYLLVREADVGVKSFVCPESYQTAFVNTTADDIVELSDFGPNPTDHLSYSYQFPYGKFPADGTGNPGNAVMADRNPWFDKTLTASSIDKESKWTFTDKVSLIDFLPGGGTWKQQIGNTGPHGREGQNVLFNDGHVSFVKRPDVGTLYDNIYTIGGETEVQKRIGTAPTGMSIDSADAEDSLLVNDR
jgi:prepilin-type processing-associated H-X9-DG protein